MRKTLTVLGAMAFMLIATVAIGVENIPDEIVIKEAQAKQAPVTFPHAKHATELVKSCDTCHHTNEGMTAKSDVQPQACSECHLDPEGDVPSMRQMSLKKNPFHITCINCHKEETKGPSKCNECHVK